MAEPALRDLQFLVQLLDPGLVQASLKFADPRGLLKSFGALTPDVDALAQVEPNPALLNLAVATLGTS
jgi:hypothetical protein